MSRWYCCARVFGGGLFAVGVLSFSTLTTAQEPIKKFDQQDKFRQLEEILPTPTDNRTASGAPGRDYWQQTVDYVIDVTLDDTKQAINGSAKITYQNHSPDPLRYIWLQLDPNMYSPHSDSNMTQAVEGELGISLKEIQRRMERSQFDGAVRIEEIVDSESGEKLKFTIVKTMMRVDLPKPLAVDKSFAFNVGWTYAINNSKSISGRTGYEFFEADGNHLYELAQWYPRACAYTDVTGWQHKQYLGRGEFTLEFGNYDVRITVPADHVVAASGTLQNAEQVLTKTQRDRFASAKNATTPIFIVTPGEAKTNESSKSTETKTWIFRAENVRDFAFASSRKFIWDAMGVKLGDQTVMAMSFYPNEGEPLWSRYSTHAIAHALEVYSRFTFDYPYPVAISVNGPVGGMEYPMISFNGPRPDKDGTYPARTKYGLISVVIHEVGHNWFPMIVNSDERQWTWMDEGLTTFLQFQCEQEWEAKYPSRRGDPKNIVDYMKSANQVPIMTSSDSLLQFGPNAYAKPATALNILRETVLGRELFDFAFKEYANRWKFKRPMPADFFRSMEDASGVDLDWFWRGWFYSTDHVDMSIESVRKSNLNSEAAYIEKPKQIAKRDATLPTLTQERNESLSKRTDRFPELNDFYNEYDPLKVTDEDRVAYEKMVDALAPQERELLGNSPYMYLVNFKNVGGLVMPLIIEIEYENGDKEMQVIPAEVWRLNNQTVTKMLMLERPIKQLRLDPRSETADIDESNNLFPRNIGETTTPLTPDRPRRGGDPERPEPVGPNPMRKMLDASKQPDGPENSKGNSDPSKPGGSESAPKQGGGGT